MSPVSRSAETGKTIMQKAATGIAGFDEITDGGLPRARTTLILGGPGAGKTVFALETLVRGAEKHNEPGIFVALEETSKQIIENGRTFGWDIPELESKHLFFLNAQLSPRTVAAGDFDLSGMLAGISEKIREMKAKRIVFDGLDVLLRLLDDPVAERREVYRIQEFLLEHEITGIITAKADPDDREATERYAFMQFMVDCIVSLQHRMLDRVSLRGLRVVKYRGSAFAENEFPVVITSNGMRISTFGSDELRYNVSTERVSTGVPRLDTMLDGGYYRASSVLVTGSPGTSKTTLAGAFVAAACERGEAALFVSFDEAGAQIVRNLASVGLDLQPHVDSGLLRMYSIRTESRSAEEHLLTIKTMMREHPTRVLVLDPISALAKTGGQVAAVHASLRLLDCAKSDGITVFCTSLVAGDEGVNEATSTQISTIADTWLHLSYLVRGGERNRALTVVKSRGMPHSNQVRELILSSDGITLADVYTAGGEVLAGTARFEKEAEVEEAARNKRLEEERRQTVLRLAEAEIKARIQALELELEAKRAELQLGSDYVSEEVERAAFGREIVKQLRSADDGNETRTPGRQPRKGSTLGRG